MNNIENLKNPKVGIASAICMIMSIIVLALGFLFVIIGINTYNAQLYMTSGYFILLSLVISVPGLITGIIGCCSSREYKKTLSITSLSINSFIFIFVVFLFILGASAR